MKKLVRHSQLLFVDIVYIVRHHNKIQMIFNSIPCCSSKSKAYFIFRYWQMSAAIQHAVCVCLRYNAQFLAAFLFFMLLLGKRYCANGYYPSSLQRSFAIAMLWKAHICLIKVFLLHHLCLVLNRDKMHDPGNALWNVRMRIYFDANM